MSGAPPGSQAFLGSLQDATTKLWKRLSTSEQQIFVNLSNKWSDEFPPPNVQARHVYHPPYINTLMSLRQNGKLSEREGHPRFSTANIQGLRCPLYCSVYTSGQNRQNCYWLVRYPNFISDGYCIRHFTDVKLRRSKMIHSNHLFLFALDGRMLKYSGNGRNMRRRYINQVSFSLIPTLDLTYICTR